jgi:hypothetical protein
VYYLTRLSSHYQRPIRDNYRLVVECILPSHPEFFQNHRQKLKAALEHPSLLLPSPAPPIPRVSTERRSCHGITKNSPETPKGEGGDMACHERGETLAQCAIRKTSSPEGGQSVRREEAGPEGVRKWGNGSCVVVRVVMGIRNVSSPRDGVHVCVRGRGEEKLG